MSRHDNPIQGMPGGSVAGCIQKMKRRGTIDDPGAYCAAIADRIEPGWRSRKRNRGDLQVGQRVWSVELQAPVIIREIGRTYARVQPDRRGSLPGSDLDERRVDLNDLRELPRAHNATKAQARDKTEARLLAFLLEHGESQIPTQYMSLARRLHKEGKIALRRLPAARAWGAQIAPGREADAREFVAAQAAHAARPRIDWDALPLGHVPDSEIIRRLGGAVTPTDVYLARKERGAQACRPRRPPELADIDWDKQPLGQRPDTDVARELGVDTSRVGAQRRKRGIKAFQRRRNAADVIPIGRAVGMEHYGERALPLEAEPPEGAFRHHGEIARPLTPEERKKIRRLRRELEQ